MQKQVSTTPGGAHIFAGLIGSCGTSGCFESIKRLKNVRETTLLSEIGLDENGNWRMAAFQRIGWFAAEEGIEVLDVFDVARYFGGRLHIEIMLRLADHAGLGHYLGRDVGLVTHVLLPLEDGEYRNRGHVLRFGKCVEFNPEDEGWPCYHLGVIVRIPLTKTQVEQIKKEQAASAPFMEALARIKEPIEPPDEYWEALKCTIKKATT